MPGRNYGRRRNYAPRAIVNSIKNHVVLALGTSGTAGNVLLAKAVNTPLSTVSTDCSQGCIIKAIYLIIDGCGLANAGVLNNMNLYIIKSPGDNLTLPGANATGTSNEKKFIFREWKFMIMRNQDGNTPFHWEGWIKIPKRYQRMGTDDVLRFAHINTAAVTGHLSIDAIYKWYR